MVIGSCSVSSGPKALSAIGFTAEKHTAAAVPNTTAQTPTSKIFLMICRPEGGWRTIFSLINGFCFSWPSSVPLSSRLSAISLLLTKNLTSYYTVLTLNMQVFVRSEFSPIVNIGGCGILVRVNRIFCTTLRRLLIKNEPKSIKNPGIYEDNHPTGKPCGLSSREVPVPGTVPFF